MVFKPALLVFPVRANAVTELTDTVLCLTLFISTCLHHQPVGLRALLIFLALCFPVCPCEGYCQTWVFGIVRERFLTIKLLKSSPSYVCTGDQLHRIHMGLGTLLSPGFPHPCLSEHKLCVYSAIDHLSSYMLRIGPSNVSRVWTRLITGGSLLMFPPLIWSLVLPGGLNDKCAIFIKSDGTSLLQWVC